MVRRARGGSWAIGGGFRGCSFEVSIEGQYPSINLCSMEERTCSEDVLMKTGGPLSMVMNIGTSFFKKGLYMFPDM